MKEQKIKNIFVAGAIAPSAIAEVISAHDTRTNIGGHSIFLGQVRADQIDGRHVSEIEYTAYEQMALEKMHEIREQIFARHDLTCAHVYHSLGRVRSGEICLMVFTSSKHRKAAIAACSEMVEMIKADLPIWGQEFFQDQTTQWKINK